MRDIRNRSLVTALVPALLLTASLSLPAVAVGAPAAGAKAVAADKADKQNNKKKNQKQAQQRNAQRREQAKPQQQRAAQQKAAQQKKAAQQQAAAQQRAARQQQQARQQQAARQQRLAQQQAAAQQRAARQQQAVRQQRLAEQRAAQQRVVAQRQQAQRLEAQRRAERQHQVELARQAELRRQELARRQAEARRAQVQRDRSRNRYYGGRYDNVRDYGWRYGEQLHVDGFLIDADRDCLILRDHNGRTFGLVGGTGGLDVGDHAQLRAVVTEDYCDAGSTLEVREVKTVWEGDRHDRAWYYYQRDGSFGRFVDRARGDDRYDDDRYYDDRYDGIDWDDRGDLMSLTGRLQSSGQCTILDTGGRDYALVGDLRGHDRGDKVKVIGVPGNGSRCGRQVLEIGEITRD